MPPLERVKNPGQAWSTQPEDDTGGSQPAWVELFNSDDLANLDDTTQTGGGTWVLGAGSVISQTDDTDDDDTQKTCAFDLTSVFTKEAISGLTGLAISVECRADMAPGTNEFQVFGLSTQVGNLGLIKSGSDMVVYEDFVTVVPEGTWSVQSYAVSAVATSYVADGVVMNDGGGSGGLPRANGLAVGSSSPTVDLVAYVGHLRNTNDIDVGLLTKNGKGSFRKFRILGLYGLPAIPA